MAGFRVEAHAGGVIQLAGYWRDVADRADDLQPLGYRVRDRWHESERRVFFARKGWAPRAASTLARYRYPVRRWRRGGRKGRGRGPLRHPMPGAVGVYTGRMHVALTRPHQPGVRDTVIAGRGAVSVIVGVQRKGAIAHANLFHQGAGSRPAREVVVFDAIAERDSASDTLEYIAGRHGRRRS